MLYFFWKKNNNFVFTSSSINICCWRKWSHSFFKLSPKSSSIKSPSPPVFARADCSSGSSSGATVVSSSVVSLATSKRGEKKNQKDLKKKTRQNQKGHTFFFFGTLWTDIKGGLHMIDNRRRLRFWSGQGLVHGVSGIYFYLTVTS